MNKNKKIPIMTIDQSLNHFLENGSIAVWISPYKDAKLKPSFTKFWDGNVVEPGQFISNGSIIIDTNVINNNAIQKLANKQHPEFRFKEHLKKQPYIKGVFDKYVDLSNKCEHSMPNVIPDVLLSRTLDDNTHKKIVYLDEYPFNAYAYHYIENAIKKAKYPIERTLVKQDVAFIIYTINEVAFAVVASYKNFNEDKLIYPKIQHNFQKQNV